MTIHVPAQKPCSVPCPIAFVAEAPGAEELDKGKPLIGPSGRVFNGALRSAGLDREDFWVGNVFDEKLPDNEIGNWCVNAKVAKERGLIGYLPPIGSCGYLEASHHWHLTRLREELAAARPVVVVPLGATALWAFTGDDNIS